MFRILQAWHDKPGNIYYRTNRMTYNNNYGATAGICIM